MQEKKILSSKLISLQLKQAIFLAFLKAKKYGTNTVSSKFLLYGILKINNSLASKTINNLYSSQTIFNNKVDKILTQCELEFKNIRNTNIIDTEDLTFSRPIRRLLFSILKSIKKDNCNVITTFQVLTLLIRNKTVRVWIKNVLTDKS
jgi:ATP-dependent Clp protease ATP-binding subunit ClpA